MYVCCESCLQRPGWDSCRQHCICKSGDFVHTHLTEKLRVLREKAESIVDVNEVTESDRSQEAAQCSSDGWVMTGLWTANDSLRSEVSSPGMFLTPWKRGRLTHPSGQMTGKYLGMWISGKQQQRGTRVQVKVKWRSTNKYLDFVLYSCKVWFVFYVLRNLFPVSTNIWTVSNWFITSALQHSWDFLGAF